MNHATTYSKSVWAFSKLPTHASPGPAQRRAPLLQAKWTPHKLTPTAGTRHVRKGAAPGFQFETDDLTGQRTQSPSSGGTMQRRSSINNAAHRPSISGPLGQSGDTRRSSISATAGVVGVVSTMRRPSISTRRPSAGNAQERRPSISGAGGGAARAPSNSRQSRGFGRQTSLNDTAT